MKKITYIILFFVISFSIIIADDNLKEYYDGNLILPLFGGLLGLYLYQRYSIDQITNRGGSN